jgi:hypothetical protein
MMLRIRQAIQVLLLLTILVRVSVNGYHHKPCTRRVRHQFQFPDCYIPPMDSSLLLSKASFLFSHDTATGYLQSVNILSTYAKNQVGTAYDQLHFGARALDLRPKLLSDGTITFQHGSVPIPVTLETFVADAVRWCHEHDDELVLLLPSNLAYENETSYDGGAAYVAAATAVYEKLGVTYLSCQDVYGLTIAEVMELSRLASGGGYLLALDGYSSSGSFCGKGNWVEQQIVTCYSYPDSETRVSVQCTDSQTSEPLTSLHQYAMASVNNEPTDDVYTLGPAADLYNTPLSEIQALWQVDTDAVTKGLSHFSTLLEDNRRSQLNADIVDWVYKKDFDAIGLLAVDNVGLYGNALLSVLRNTCGQSTADVCGTEIDPPQLKYVPLTWYVNVASVFVFVVVAGIAGRKVWSRHGNDMEAALLRNQYVT